MAWKYTAWNFCRRVAPVVVSCDHSTHLRVQYEFPVSWRGCYLLKKTLQNQSMLSTYHIPRIVPSLSIRHEPTLNSATPRDIWKRKIWTSLAIIEPLPSRLQPVALLSYVTQLKFFYVHTKGSYFKANCHCEIWFLHGYLWHYQLPR